MNPKCEFIKCSCPSAQKIKKQDEKYTFRYIDEQLNLIYYNVPKVASTSITKLLFSRSQCLRNPEEPIDKYFKFSFVRNPFARAVSNFKMFTGKAVNENEKIKVDQMKEFLKEPEKLTFIKFLNFINEKDNHHWQPQSDFIPPNVDFVGKLENISNDILIVFDKAKIQGLTLPHFNKTIKDSYLDYYDEESKSLVESKYQKDFERFGYEFDK